MNQSVAKKTINRDRENWAGFPTALREEEKEKRGEVQPRHLALSDVRNRTENDEG